MDTPATDGEAANAIADMADGSVKKHWNPLFLSPSFKDATSTALIVLNQPFSLSLLKRLWSSSNWHACADGGANRLYDLLQEDEQRARFLPNLIKGDLDSIRQDVRSYYSGMGVDVVFDGDQDTTDLQKCLASLSAVEETFQKKFTVILLGGLSGRLDQTIHTLSLLHKLRRSRENLFAITDENLGWVLDSGEHTIEVDLQSLGPTCGLLPVGVESTVISTRGLEWDLAEAKSSFDGLVSTSNHVSAPLVWVKTTKPIWWCVELKSTS